MAKSTLHKLYGGDVTLKFSSSAHRYWATIPDKGVTKEGVPSATGIVGVLDKPALMYWAVNETVDYLREKLRPGETYDEVEIEQLLESAKKARYKTSGKATTIGSLVHDWIERYVKCVIEYGEVNVVDHNDIELEDWDLKLPYNKEAQASISSFLEWESNHDVEWLTSERKVFSKRYGYAGTLDAEVVVDGKYSVLDLKTSKRIYPEYWLQLACYKNALDEERLYVDQAAGRVEQTIILRIPKNEEGFEAAMMSNPKKLDYHIQVFLACLKVYRWKKMKDLADEVFTPDAQLANA